MIKKIEGKKYHFEIDYLPLRKNIAFEFVAIDKSSGRCSTINTLNAFLSWCGIDVDDPRSEKSDWIVSKKEFRRLQRDIVKLISAKDSLSYFEQKLDEDRIEGEWERVRTPPEGIG